MDAARFDQVAVAAVFASGNGTSRRAVLGGLLGGAMSALLAREDTPARRRKGRKGRKCKSSQTRCKKRCVNTNTDEKNCGRCGNRCANGVQCLNGTCFSDDICPFAQEACPNFRHCGAEGEDSDCFCGSTTGGQSVCFQDENFCEFPRPCQNTNDCEDGRVCVDTSLCCEAFDAPDQPRTCLLPCEIPSATGALAKEGARKVRNQNAGSGPGAGSH